MKVEVNPDGIVRVETDAAQALAGIYAVHVSQDEDGVLSAADHSAAEIEDAVKASLLPVLFFADGPVVIPCHLDRVVWGDENVKAYEFRGFTNYGGAVVIAIDRTGKAYFPK